jgi:hypothetical protein
MLYISERREFIRIYNDVFPLALSKERGKKEKKEKLVLHTELERGSAGSRVLLYCTSLLAF